MATRRRTRRSKVETNEGVEEGDNINTNTVSSSEQIAGKEKDSLTKSTEIKQEENPDEQEEQIQNISSADALGSTEDTPSESTGTKMSQEIQESGGSRKETVAGENESTVTMAVTREKKNEEGESNNIKRDKDGGFCLFVGNLNNSKTSEEIKHSLSNYFLTQSLLFQDIRLDRSKKHAHVDLASEMDLTKALTLNGEMLLDKPMRVEKAKIKSEDNKVKVKVPAEDKNVNGKRKADSTVETSPSKKTRLISDGFCLFVGNLNNSKTSKEIKCSLTNYFTTQSLMFQDIRLDRSKKYAHVDLASEMDMTKALTLNGEMLLDKPMRVEKAKNKSEDKVKVKVPVEDKKAAEDAKTKGRVLSVDCIEENMPEAARMNDDNNTKAAAPPNKKEKKKKKVVQEAVSSNIPQKKGKSKGKKNTKMSENAPAVSKTLVVMGLAEKTTAATLKSAFEGALSAKVIKERETGASKRFGFVVFKSEENCKAVKADMEDCEIDGSRVSVSYAKPKREKGPPGARGGLAGRPVGHPAGQKAAGGKKGSRGVKIRDGLSSGKGCGAGKQQNTVKKKKKTGSKG